MIPARAATLAATALAAALVLQACTGGAGRAGDGAAQRDEGIPSALEDREHPAFPEPLIDPDQLLSGGPPPDGIPSIDDRAFDPVDEVDWLGEGDPVLSLTVGAETRAYPLAVMTWHEIVNDTVDGIPMTVTYCPLCNSGVAFTRTVAGEATTFGVSGLLYADNLVMYDRATESLWPQLTGTASVGARTGEQLEAVPMGVVGWSQFARAHPDSLVLSRRTGHSRPYGRNPYVGYDAPGSDALFPLPEGTEDGRLDAKQRVIGLRDGREALAVRRADVVREGVVELTVGDQPVTLWGFPGQRSALGAQEIAQGEDIGTVATLDPTLDGRELAFRRADGKVRDRQTGSTWDPFGHAVAGPLSGQSLRAVVHLDTFWFAWVAFRPETEVHRS